MLTVVLVCPICHKKINKITEQSKEQLIAFCVSCGEINLLVTSKPKWLELETKKKLPEETYFEW